MNWIAVVVLLAVFLLVVWLTSLIARVAGAGRSGIGWVFLAIIVSGLASGVMALFIDFSGMQWVGWLISFAVSVLVFALVLDAGLLGGVIISLAFNVINAFIVAAAFFFGISNIGELTRTIESDPSVPGQSQEIVRETEPEEPVVPAEAPAETEAEVAQPPTEETGDTIIGYKVDGPLKDYSFDDEMPATAGDAEEPAYRVTDLDSAGEYIRYRVRVRRSDDVVFEGVLAGVSETSVDIRHRESGGYAILHLDRAGIRLFEVLR
jgi:hypothetical protein